MKSTHRLHLPPRAAALALTVVVLAIISCASNDELQDRLDDRNDSYSNFQKRREMRSDARQGRTDAWFDRVMH
jgi:hypothetical protein